ncbi:hypothetical protein BH09PSE1_BH09PSE1_07460 [soil metagenome]
MSELERYDPAVTGRIKYEHFHRYALAAVQVAGLRVLDIASGEGYGSAMLAESAASVDGVDIDATAVASANARYRRPDRLRFHVGSVENIPFEEDTFDVVVSFETIEHIEDPQALLKEVKRVLKPGGFAIISTPNKTIYNRYLQQANHFHLSEMEAGEFTALLDKYFKHQIVLGQRMVVASAISPASLTSPPNSGDYRGFTAVEEAGHSPFAKQAVVRLPDPEYMICLVSDVPLAQPDGADSIFLSPAADLWTEHAQILRWASGLHDEDEILRAALRDKDGVAGELENARMQIALLREVETANRQALTHIQAQDQGLPVLAAMASELAGAPVGAEMSELVRSLGQAAVRQAVQDMKLSEAQGRLDEARLQAESLRVAVNQGEAVVSELVATKAALSEGQLAREGLEARLREQERTLLEQRDAHAAAEAANALVEKQASLIDRREREALEARSRLEEAERHTREVRVQLTETRDVLERMASEISGLKADTAATLPGEPFTEEQYVSEAEDAPLPAPDEPSAILETATHDLEDIRKNLTALVEASADKAVQGEESPLEQTAPVGASRRKPARRPGRTHDGRDALFSDQLKQRLQQSIVDQITHYRTGLAAAVTIRGMQREMTEADAKAARAVDAGSLPPPRMVVDTGAKRSASGLKGMRKSVLRQLRGHSPEIRDQAAAAALFDPEYYLIRNSVTPGQGETPFDHYARSGRLKGLPTHPLIDPDWISATWPKGRNRFDLFQYLNDPSLHDLTPHPAFDAAHYRRMNQDVASAGIAPLAHYTAYGWRERREPNQLFSPAWYLSNHQDVLAAEREPLGHYIEAGAAEGRQPHPLFDRDFYLEHYPDVARSGMDPYIHFIAYGRAEGRAPSRRVLEMDRLTRFFGADRIMDLISGGDPEQRLKLAGDHFWPPVWDGQYWLPQRLRDLLVDRYGEGRLDLFVYLFSLIERYGDKPESFDHSPDAEKLIARARTLAAVTLEGQPTASVIIPVYNNLLYTLTCIVSVLESAPRVSFEILVADDRSSDRTPEAIAEIGGLVKHVRHKENLGFLGNCNAAAHKAAGDFIILLNNDTIVLPGWLENLIKPMMADTEIGFIGSKLLNGDGTLQEAGGIFWDDGSAWNYGRDQDSLLPAFNYQKDVDYISGASIGLPMPLWRKLGGFDPIFAPAYCEDSDLAFRVRQAGFRTVYQPHSALVHHEGRSHGRDTASGIKAYQVINQEKLLKRWSATLAAENLPNGTDVFLARDRSQNRPHLLIVDHYLPQWDQDAGSRTMFHFIRAFVNRGFQVTFWPDNLFEDRDYAVQLQRMGVEVIYGHQYVNRFDEWLSQNGRYLDYVLLSRPHVAERYIDTVNRAKLKTIYYGHDLHCMRARSAYELSALASDLAEAEIWEAREIGVCRRCDVVMYPGIEEVAFIREHMPAGVAVIQPPITIFDEDDLEVGEQAVALGEDVDPFALMFVGGFAHAPNGDGVDWFLSEIWPRLIAADTRFTLRIAGSRMPDSLRQRSVQGVTMLGRLSEEELAQMYATSGIVVVPLRFGGGIKGKVIEAFANGVPVAMTDIGAQGIPDAAALGFVTPADETFADAILQAAHDRPEALRRASRGVDFLRRFYSEQAFCDLLVPEVPELSQSAAEPS